MSSIARRATTREDVEKTLKKIAQNQNAYYEQWLEQWVRLIEERAQPRTTLDRIATPISRDTSQYRAN